MASNDDLPLGFCDSLGEAADADTVKRAVAALIGRTPKTKAEALDLLDDALDGCGDARALRRDIAVVLGAVDAKTLRSWLIDMEVAPARTKAENVDMMAAGYADIILANRRAAVAKPARGAGRRRSPERPSAREAAPAMTPAAAGPLATPSAPSQAEAEAVARRAPGERLIIHVVSSSNGALAKAWGLARVVQGVVAGASLPPKVPIAHAASVFSFHGGYPVENALYVLDPFDPTARSYLPATASASLVTRATIAHFHRLALALGARRIEVLHAEAQGRAIDASMIAQMVGHAVGVQARLERSAQQETRLVTELGEPRHRPYVPQELVQFLQLHPELQTLCYDALHGNPSAKEIVLESRTAADIAGRLSGLEAIFPDAAVGGGTRSESVTRWKFRVEFLAPAAPPVHFASQGNYAAPQHPHAAHYAGWQGAPVQQPSQPYVQQPMHAAPPQQGWYPPAGVGGQNGAWQSAPSEVQAAQPQAAAFCPNCGARAVAVTPFCAHCGKPMPTHG